MANSDDDDDDDNDNSNDNDNMSKMQQLTSEAVTVDSRQAARVGEAAALRRAQWTLQLQ